MNGSSGLRERWRPFVAKTVRSRPVQKCRQITSPHSETDDDRVAAKTET
jgi:hypothetical protein